MLCHTKCAGCTPPTHHVSVQDRPLQQVLLIRNLGIRQTVGGVGQGGSHLGEADLEEEWTWSEMWL